MKFNPGLTTTRRDVLIGGLAGGLISARPSMAAGLFGSSDGDVPIHSDGCVICQLSRSMQFSERLVRKPSQSERSLRVAQVTIPSTAAGAAAAATKSGSARTTVIQPSWILVPRGDGLDMVSDHDVIVQNDRIEAVRPRQRTTDLIIEASGQILLPGLISGHSHAAAGTLTRGWIEENGVIDRS